MYNEFQRFEKLRFHEQQYYAASILTGLARDIFLNGWQVWKQPLIHQLIEIMQEDDEYMITINSRQLSNWFDQSPKEE